jgi:hypothetical protein
MNKAQLAFLFVSLPASALLAQGPRDMGPGPMALGRGAGMGGPGMGGPGVPGGGAVVTGAPYSATEVVQSQETLVDGNVIQRKHQSNVYRDSSGRVRIEETVTPDASTGKAPYTRISILDYVAGKRYELNSSTMTAHESPLHAPPARPANAATGTNPPLGRRGGGGGGAGTATGAVERPNVVRTTLAPQSVNGVLASGTQHSETIPAGAIGNSRPIQTSRTMWVSTDLKIPVQIKSSDPRFGTTQMDLTNIIQAEPSASMFVIPPGYTVTSGGPGFGGPRGGGPGGGGAGRQQVRGPRPPAPPQ